MTGGEGQEEHLLYSQLPFLSELATMHHQAFSILYTNMHGGFERVSKQTSKTDLLKGPLKPQLTLCHKRAFNLLGGVNKGCGLLLARDL